MQAIQVHDFANRLVGASVISEDASRLVNLPENLTLGMVIREGDIMYMRTRSGCDYDRDITWAIVKQVGKCYATLELIEGEYIQDIFERTSSGHHARGRARPICPSGTMIPKKNRLAVDGKLYKRVQKNTESYLTFGKSSGAMITNIWKWYLSSECDADGYIHIGDSSYS